MAVSEAPKATIAGPSETFQTVSRRSSQIFIIWEVPVNKPHTSGRAPITGSWNSELDHSLTTTLTTTRRGFRGVWRGFGIITERENPAICGALWGCRRRIRTFTN